MGRRGEILGPMGLSGFLVRMDNGSIFNFPTQNLQTVEELAFTPGQRVTVIAPPFMGHQGTIQGRVPWLDGFRVRLDNDEVFAFSTQSLHAQTLEERVHELEELLTGAREVLNGVCEDLELLQQQVRGLL